MVCDFTVLLFGNGGAFLDASGKPVFNNDKGVQVLTWMKQTIDDGLSNPSSVSSDENAVEADFLAGKSAFAVNWLFQYSDSNDATKSQIVGQAAFAPMPVFAAGAAAGIKGSSVDGSSSFAIMATTPYPDQTWKFLTYLASNAVQIKYSAEMLPVWQNDFQGDALTNIVGCHPHQPGHRTGLPGAVPLCQRTPDRALLQRRFRCAPTGHPGSPDGCQNPAAGFG